MLTGTHPQITQIGQADSEEFMPCRAVPLFRKLGRQAGRHRQTDTHPHSHSDNTHPSQGYAEQYFGGIPGLAEGGAVLVKMLAECSVASVLGKDWAAGRVGPRRAGSTGERLDPAAAYEDQPPFLPEAFEQGPCPS